MSTDLIEQYLIHSYLYYVCSDSIISDFEFDDLCKRLNESFYELESPYKDVLIQLEGDFNPEEPYRGCDGLEEQFPLRLRERAHTMADDYHAAFALDLKNMIAAIWHSLN